MGQFTVLPYKFLTDGPLSYGQLDLTYSSTTGCWGKERHVAKLWGLVCWMNTHWPLGLYLGTVARRSQLRVEPMGQPPQVLSNLNE